MSSLRLMSRNIPLFIAFRLLFNARFYYPVFAVIQLDYGLTMSQFAILNAVWAVSIVLLEVPSGALADRIGRKRMVLIASILMVCEMALIAFVPLGHSAILFGAWVLNRILSGAAEAAASGADEALAYDSLPKEQAKELWPKVLSRLMFLSSLSFVGAMLVGAAVYDVNMVNQLLSGLGVDWVLAKETVIRFPIYLTLFTAIIAVFVATAMKEPPQETQCGGECSLWSSIFAAGGWILRTPVVFALILAALIHDSLVRLFLTMNSEYYRLIGIPVSAFGLIGAAFAAIGMFTPKLAARLVERGRMPTNYLIISVLTFLGLLGVAQAWPIYGVLMIIPFAVSFTFLNFFTSHYLNAEVESSHRATVLSFKGLALNVGFGVLSLLYAGLLKGLRQREELPESAAADPAFPLSLTWLPGTFLVMLAPLLLYYQWRLRRASIDRE